MLGRESPCLVRLEAVAEVLMEGGEFECHFWVLVWVGPGSGGGQTAILFVT